MEKMNHESYFDINEIPKENDNDKINCNDETSLQDQTGRVYALCLNVYANIIHCDQTERDKLCKILLTILKNIIDNPNEEKFKKLKLSNKNIMSLFEIQGVYDIAKYLGFREEFLNDEDHLFLSLENNYNKEAFELVYSFLNLLITDDEEHTSEKKIDSDASYEYPSLAELNSSQNTNNKQFNNTGSNIVDILRDTKNSRLNTQDNNNIWGNSNRRQTKNKDIKSILKETADIRRLNSQYSNYYQGQANTYSQHNSLNNNNWGINNGNSAISPSNKKFATLSDIKFSNPDLSAIYRRDYKINDEIGKKCLALTNEFRSRNGLPPVEWNDDIWKISIEHSNNMGLKKVKFGHDGFNNRIAKLPFHYALACENVFMCNGYSEYNVAELSVNGWINSPGHRKNLLSKSSHCAIAVYRNGYGEYFLTQIFVRK